MFPLSGPCALRGASEKPDLAGLARFVDSKMVETEDLLGPFVPEGAFERNEG